MSESDFGCFEFFNSSSISMDLHSTAPAVSTAFWVELDLRCCYSLEWLSLSQISGLIRGVVRVSQLAERKYFANLSFSLESGNLLDNGLLINSVNYISAAGAGPDSSALRKSSAISDNNGSLSPSLCSSRARGFSLEVLSASVPQRA